MTTEVISPYTGLPIPEWSAERAPCPRCHATIGMGCFTGPSGSHTFAVRPHAARKRLADRLRDARCHCGGPLQHPDDYQCLTCEERDSAGSAEGDR